MLWWANSGEETALALKEVTVCWKTQPCEGVMEEGWKYARGHTGGPASSVWG